MSNPFCQNCGHSKSFCSCPMSRKSREVLDAIIREMVTCRSTCPGGAILQTIDAWATRLKDLR